MKPISRDLNRQGQQAHRGFARRRGGGQQKYGKVTQKWMLATLEVCSKALAVTTIGIAHAGDLPPTAEAGLIAYGVPQGYAWLIWAPLLLLILACTCGLLWMIRSDAKRDRYGGSRNAKRKGISYSALANNPATQSVPPGAAGVCLVFMNSWSACFGDAGYYYMPVSYFESQATEVLIVSQEGH